MPRALRFYAFLRRLRWELRSLRIKPASVSTHAIHQGVLALGANATLQLLAARGVAAAVGFGFTVDASTTVPPPPSSLGLPASDPASIPASRMDESSPHTALSAPTSGATISHGI
jgi:hypothetical protein